MLWYSWLMIGIVCVGIIYLIADKFILPWYRFNKNKKRAATWIYCTFFHPSGGFPQRMLCKPSGAYFIEVPKDHEEFFSKTENGKVPQYCLIGTEVVGQDKEGNNIERPIRLTYRDLWPFGAPLNEQVPIETAYFVMGRQEALNPFRNFLPVNTDMVNLMLREDKSMQAVNAQQNRELESWETLSTGVAKIAKLLPWVLIAACGSLVAGLVAAILGFLIKKGM